MDHTTASQVDCSAQIPADYDLKIHLAGIFIILVVSGSGVFGSLFLGHLKDPPQWAKVALQLSKMFGIGVIAGTAWIHLLPEAFNQFSNPCLEGEWKVLGPSWVGIFGLLAAFMVQLLEMAGHHHANYLAESRHDHRGHASEPSTSVDQLVEHCAAPCNSHITVGSENFLLNTHSPINQHLHDAVYPDITYNPATSLSQNDSNGPETTSREQQEADRGQIMKKVSTIVLEMGILTHSLVIGLTLGISDDSEFNTLIIAIAFHQFFEGLALGSFVASTTLSFSSKLVLGIMYPLTTPIGVAIGLILHSSLNTNSSSLILAQGILESLSGGILIYSTYCELVGGEIHHNPTFEKYSKNFKVVCFFTMYFGAALMALLAIWA